MLKIFLMTKNEFELLEDWIKYHGCLFGYQNLYVVDGSDEERVFEIYRRYEKLGLNVFYSQTKLNGLARELTHLMHVHKGRNNFLIKLDTDEFLAYSNQFKVHTSDLSKSPLRRDYLWSKFWKGILKFFNSYAHRNDQPHIYNFRQFFASLPITGQRYKASLTALSIPRREYLSKPARVLTKFTPNQFTHFKSFFHSSSFVEVDLGCHSGVSTQNNGVIDTGLMILHYQNTSIDDSARRAKQVLVSHEYIGPMDSIEQQRCKLLEIRSHGDVASFNKIDFYLMYIDSLENNKPLDPLLLNRHHPFFWLTGGPRQMTLVRDKLNMIDTELALR